MVGSPDFLTGKGTDQSSDFEELESPEGEMHLRFYLTSGQELALPAIAIREVTEPPPDRITPVPNCSPLLLGTLNVRGQVIWVVDLGQFLGETTPLNTDRPEIPVIAIEDRDTMLGLAVSRIARMDWLDPDRLQACSALSTIATPFLRGQWPPPSAEVEPLKLLDHDAILRSDRLGYSPS